LSGGESILVRHRYVVLAVAFLILIAVVRILLTYKVTAQAFDEPCHIAAAIEFLDKGTYTLDPVHPPLVRIAIGIPLYLAGARFPDWPATDPRIRNYNEVGNSIIDGGGHYLRNLSLARSATLPFFGLAVILVFLWTRREFGEFTGVMAAVFFTTLPIVLAFSGVAYTDLPAGCMQFAALFAFTTWLQKPALRSSLLLGLVTGLAFLAKLTTLLFLPAAATAIVLSKWLIERRTAQTEARNFDGKTGWPGNLGIALAAAVIVIWAGYGFSVGHIREAMQISPQSMPSFQHFPGPVRTFARTIVQKDFLLPAPALVSGVATAWALNKSAPAAYLLGKVKHGGWWYFFLVGVGVKTPPSVSAAVSAWTLGDPGTSAAMDGGCSGCRCRRNFFRDHVRAVQHGCPARDGGISLAGGHCRLRLRLSMAVAGQMARGRAIRAGCVVALAVCFQSEGRAGLHLVLQRTGRPRSQPGFGGGLRSGLWAGSVPPVPGIARETYCAS
jgi:hypothetical protein